MYGKLSKSIFWKAHCISCCHYVSLSQKYKSLPMSTREIKTPGLFWFSTFCYDWRNWSRWEKKHRNVLDQLLRLKAVGFPLKCPRQYPETSRNPSDTFSTAYYTNKKPPISSKLTGTELLEGTSLKHRHRRNVTSHHFFDNLNFHQYITFATR